MEYAVIMAGGSGTRLWPLSRRGMPKQLLPLIGGRSLLQLAYERAVTVVDPSCVLICAARAYVADIAQQLPGIDLRNILPEPVGRDSLAAAAWSVGTVARRDPGATVAVLSADHVISPVDKFTAAAANALSAAADYGALVTLGVAPTSAHTGYGYLQVGDSLDAARQLFEVTRFAEKPAREVAEAYLAEGTWWWNSGMFFWPAALFQQQLALLQPAMAHGIERLVDHPDSIDDIYPGLPRTSVDYAIMEPVSRGATEARILAVLLEADWADIGSFPALAKQLGADDHNVVEGRVVTLGSSGNLILNRSSDGRLVAVAGLDDTIVVTDDDVTLVCPMGQSGSIKQLVDLARAQGERYA